MTLKCALAGLSAGGGKCVVIDHPGLDRPRAFAELGDRIEALAGRFRTAGDLGTTEADLRTLARHTRFAHVDSRSLAGAVGRGLVRCAEACAAFASWDGLAGRRVLVQGAGAIGAAAAREFAAAGARVLIADLDAARARSAAAAIGAEVIEPQRVFDSEVDLLAPCAIGGVITREIAGTLRARVLCGAANNILASPGVAEILRERGIVHVPDVIASAGAVIDGIGESVMGLADRTPLIDRLGDTAGEVLRIARQSRRTAEAVAIEIADRRIEAARGAAR
jgi:leucine dehydrogenase